MKKKGGVEKYVAHSVGRCGDGKEARVRKIMRGGDRLRGGIP